jgi:hypothetical protein
MDASERAIVQATILASASANGGFFGGDDSASIGFDQFLDTSGVSVAAQGWSLIEVSLLAEWYALEGRSISTRGTARSRLPCPG